MPSGPRAFLQRFRTSIAEQVVTEVTPAIDSQKTRLGELEAQIAALAEQVSELRRINGTQVDVANESTELLGRLIRSATSRIDELEERDSHGR